MVASSSSSSYYDQEESSLVRGGGGGVTIPHARPYFSDEDDSELLMDRRPPAASPRKTSTNKSPRKTSTNNVRWAPRDNDNDNSSQQIRVAPRSSYAALIAEANKEASSSTTSGKRANKATRPRSTSAAKRNTISSSRKTMSRGGGGGGGSGGGLWRKLAACTTTRNANPSGRELDEEQQVVHDICRDSREFLEDIGDREMTTKQESFSIYSSETSDEDGDDEETSYGSEYVITAPSRRKEALMIAQQSTGIVMREDSKEHREAVQVENPKGPTPIAALYTTSRGSRDQEQLGRQEEENHRLSPRQNHVVERPRSVTPTVIMSEMKKMNSKSRRCFPTFRKLQCKGSSALSSVIEEERTEEEEPPTIHTTRKKTFVISPTSYFNEEVEARKQQAASYDTFFLSNRTRSAFREVATESPADEAAPSEINPSVGFQEPEEQTEPEAQEPDVPPTDQPVAPSWLDIVANALFMGTQEECAHCHDPVYKDSAHVRQYPYAQSESSRFQYLHVNCQVERAVIEERMGSVRDEFNFLNERFHQKKKQQKELRQRIEEEEAQKAALEMQNAASKKSGRKWKWLAGKEKNCFFY